MVLWNVSRDKGGRMIKINQIKLPIAHQDKELVHKLEQLIQWNYVRSVHDQASYTYKIVKKSIDARKKPELYFVYSIHLCVTMDGKENLKWEQDIIKRNPKSNLQLTEVQPYQLPMSLYTKQIRKPPIIIGSGPAGLFCAYLLAYAGCRPIIFERGETVEKRRITVKQYWNGTQPLNPESNVQFGEGGAGTFSDGKLNTLVKDPKGRNQFVLETFARYGADESITYMNKPHLGTDELTGIIQNMRNDIIEHGGEFHFETCIKDFLIQDQKIKGVITHENQVYESDHIILAIGHSARDTFHILKNKNVTMTAKSFAVGLRIEHPQEMINECQYGQKADHHLPAADYKLTNQTSNGRSVYSFCMCPGGYVVNASSEKERLAVNGMSYHERNGKNANSALIVSVTPEDFGSDDCMAGIEFQRKLEEKAYKIGHGSVPVQRYRDFKNNQMQMEKTDAFEPCIKGAFSYANLRELLPEELNAALIESIERFGQTVSGYNRPDAILSGVESRTSSPVRIVRDETGQSNIKGLYPCGEGAGYAGGITSAAMDGIKIAEYILEEYKIG